MNNLPRHLGIIVIKPEFLFKMLGLPEEVEFRSSCFDFDINCYKVKIGHKTLPQHEDGEKIAYVTPVFDENKEFKGFTLIDHPENYNG